MVISINYTPTVHKIMIKPHNSDGSSRRNIKKSTSLVIVVMDQTDDRLRNQMEAIWRVMNLAKCVNEDDVPCYIEEGLFLGSAGAAKNKNALKSNNIRHILTAAIIPPFHPNDFVYKIVHVRDTEDTNIKQYFDECFKFIDDAKEQGAGVLVHCFAGRSRSVTIIVAYLMKKHGISLAEALQHVRSKRPQVAPNSGFISQLQDFEKSLQGIPS